MSSVRAQQPAAAAQASPGSSGTPKSRLGKLGFPGLLSMIAGLVICGSFFLPWLTANLVCTDPLCSTSVVKALHFPTGSAAAPTGFSIATGRFELSTGGPFGNIH